MVMPSCFRRVCWFLAIAALACLASIGIFGCSGGQDQQQPPPVPVTTAKAQTGDAEVTLMAVGTVKASESVTVRSRVEGHILEIHFQDGDQVYRDQLLFTIDPTELELGVNEAQANLSRLRAEAAQAERELARYRDLFDQGVVSRDEYETKETAADTARQTVAAQLASASIQGQQVRYSLITSPVTGRAGSALMDMGNLVRATEDDLLVINTISPIDVVFSLPERHLAEIQRYFDGNATLEVRATGPGWEGDPERGVLTFVDNWINPETGMISLKARFANERQRMWPGQFLSVTLVLATQRDVVFVPVLAVRNGQQGRFVYLVKQGKAELQSVEVGRRVGERIVVTKGVAAGDTVVVEGQISLYPGATVWEQNATAANATSPSGAAQDGASESGGQGHDATGNATAG